MKILRISTALLLALTLALTNLSSASAAGPTVTSVTSSLPDGSYTIGQVIPVQLIFSAVVYVTGVPQLTLATGNPSRTPVNYSSGSGSTTLTFTYTVAAGNTSHDLDYVNGKSLILNGGTILDAAANIADLKLPSPGSPGSLGANKNIIIDTTVPSVTINQSATQLDPTNASPINFTVVFSEVVTDFITGDVTLSGTAGATTATVTGGPITYNVAVTGMATSGTVIVSVAPGVVHDAAGNPNIASTSTDNTVTYNISVLTVTIDQAATQLDPTNTSPINFTVVFSEVVTDFVTGDVTLGGTAGATTAAVTGSGATYNVAVSGMTTSGTVIASIAAGVAHDAATNPNIASTSTDNTVTYNTSALAVTINQAAAQPDPTNTSPINFTVVFSEVVTDFATGDIILNGTAGATTAIVTGSGTTYNVAVSGMTTTTSGTVIASIASGVAHDSFGNPNAASSSSDNSVMYDKTWPSLTWITPTPCGNPPGCIYNVINQSIILTVDASDIVGISSIEFKRWDPVNTVWIGIMTLSNPPYSSSPYSITFDTSVLPPEWNQIDVKAHDAANNVTESWIFLYHTTTWQIHLPLIIR